MKKITIIQGDVSPVYKFQRKYNDGNIISTLPKKMWITFKKNSMCDECLFQKTLENGIVFEDDFYKFQGQWAYKRLLHLRILCFSIFLFLLCRSIPMKFHAHIYVQF